MLEFLARVFGANMFCCLYKKNTVVPDPNINPLKVYKRVISNLNNDIYVSNRIEEIINHNGQNDHMKSVECVGHIPQVSHGCDD